MVHPDLSWCMRCLGRRHHNREKVISVYPSRDFVRAVVDCGEFQIGGKYSGDTLRRVATTTTRSRPAPTEPTQVSFVLA
jgi:predicted proteasome-type protease